MDSDVPDSDNEELRPAHEAPLGVSRPLTDAISSFPALPVNPTKDSISSSSSAMPPAGQRPRPKPRARHKGTTATSTIDSFSENPSSLSDRIKMRERGKKPDQIPSSLRDTAKTKSDVIEIPSDSSEDELHISPKPTTKDAVKLFVKIPPQPKPVSHSSLPPSDPFPESTNNNDQLQEEDLAPPIMTLPPLPSSPPSPAPVSKPPKKSRKKQGADDAEKPAKKPRAKKAKKDATTADGGADNGGEKPKKGKKKEKEKQVFPSAEFIGESGDDELPPPLPSLLNSVLPAPQKPVSAVSLPESQTEDDPPVVGDKRKRREEEEQEPSGSGTKKATKAKVAALDAAKPKKVPKKQAKGRVVMSEDEDEDGESMVVASVKNTKRPLAMSDDEDIDPPPQSVPRPQPAKKKAKKPVVSESEDQDDPDENPEQTRSASKSPARQPSSPHVPNATSSRVLVENARHNKPAGTPNPTLPSLSAKYTIGARSNSTPLSELIRKVNAQANSPFPVALPRRSSIASGMAPGTPVTTYSPYAKFSRSNLSRIAPLHPNRRTPPPPPPPPPPKPKTKKEKEREERWEEEMIEAVGGWEAWQALSEQDQKAAKRAKWTRELEGWED